MVTDWLEHIVQQLEQIRQDLTAASPSIGRAHESACKFKQIARTQFLMAWPFVCVPLLRSALEMERMNRELAISAELTLPYRECLESLRQQLIRAGFRVIAEVPFDREFDQHVGLKWRRYTVLLAWNAFQAYQALLDEAEAGIFLPLHFVVAEGESATRVAAANLLPLAHAAGNVGLQLLAHNLGRQIQEIFLELKKQEATPASAVLLRGKEHFS